MLGTKPMARAAVSILLFAFLAPMSEAELSPAVYKQMQRNAPEVLEIEVLSVKTTATAEETVVDVESRIRVVTRSNAGLKVGDVIHINYTRRTKLLPGASSPSLLEKGKKYPAFLAREHKNSYAPAAGGRSFEVIE